MKIECILKRVGGTKAELDGIEYHFEPLEDGAHVANIEDKEHIDRFLSISEGYKLYHGELEPKGKPVKVEVKRTAAGAETDKKGGAFLQGSDSHNSQYEIGGQIFSLGDVVRKAFAASGLSEDEWNELDEDERAAKIDIALDDLADEAERKALNPSENEDERAALVEQYVAKFGQKPNGRASIDTIKAKLAE